MIIDSMHPAVSGLFLIRDGKPMGLVTAINLSTGMATKKTPDPEKPGRSRIEVFTYQRILGNREMIPRYLWDKLELYGVELHTPEELQQIREELEG